MNGPCGLCVACAPGMPMPAGTCRAAPFTKMVRCAWMWNTVCSLVWQLIPSTGWPVAPVAVLASAGPAGTGTPSGPVGPAAGAGWRVPSVLNGARGSPPPPELPPVTASVMAITAAMTTTAAPPAISHGRRRRRRACSARSRASLSRALSLFLLLLLIGGSAGAGHRGAHDPGLVEEHRGHDTGPDAGQLRHPLVGLLADAAAHDDQLRREQRLNVMHVLIHAPGPLVPAQVVQFLGVLGGPGFRVAAPDLDVPELGVRHQDALGEQRAADPRAEGQQEHGALLTHPGPERHLGYPGRVGVVQHPD